MNSIAVSYSNFATSRSGGARESLLTLLNTAANKEEIHLDVYQTPPINNLPKTNFNHNISEKGVREIPKLTWLNQLFIRSQWKKYLWRNLDNSHDLLITLNELAPASVIVANKLDIPTFWFVHSLVITGHEKYNPEFSHMSNIYRTDFGGRIQYPFLWKNFHDYKWAANNATQTIANSEFTSNKIKSLFDAETSIIYPPIKMEKYRTEYNKNGYITMVNPRSEYKGTNIYFDISDKMPDEEFLLVGNLGSPKMKRKIEQRSNITHWEWCEDMRDVYSEAKVVIVPSTVEETFGRVAAEAMVSGIPCVVSNRGALPEVVGNTGEVVSDIESIDQWIDSIKKSMLNHDPKSQKNRVQQFSANVQADRLIQLIHNTV